MDYIFNKLWKMLLNAMSIHFYFQDANKTLQAKIWKNLAEDKIYLK